MCHAAQLIDKHGEVYTSPLFWNCKCEEGYIHPITQEICLACNTRRRDAPDARVKEIFLYAYAFHLPPVLVSAVIAAAEAVDPILTEGVAIPF